MQVVKDEAGNINVEGYDYIISGWSIVNFLNGAKKYSNYDISFIKEQIELKRKVFKDKHPESYISDVFNENFFND